MQEPDWRGGCEVEAASLPEGADDWLLDPDSLTDRLVAASGGDFRVRRLSHAMTIPLASETRLLGLAVGEAAIVREVALLCFGEAWVYARSVIPEASLKGSFADLRELGDESLGARIFREPGLRREPFQICLLPGDSDYIHKTYRQITPAWARRARFTSKGRQLMVSEVFLEKFRKA